MLQEGGCHLQRWQVDEICSIEVHNFIVLQHHNGRSNAAVQGRARATQSLQDVHGARGWEAWIAWKMSLHLSCKFEQNILAGVDDLVWSLGRLRKQTRMKLF